MTSSRSDFTVPRFALVALLGCLLASCGGADNATGPSDGGEPVRTGLFRVGGATLADTIEGSVTITFEILNASKPQSGVVVWLKSTPRTDHKRMLRFAATAGEVPADSLSLSTGSDGHVTFLALLGTFADSVTVTASAPTGSPVPVSVEVRGGAPVKMEATPLDTTLYVDASFPLAAAPRDRMGNVSYGAVTFTSLEPGVAEVSSTGQVTARGIGRTRIAATLGSFGDTVGVSVPPRGRIAYSRFRQLYEVNLDGSDPVLVMDDDQKVAAPAWNADGTKLTWSTGVSSYPPSIFGSLMLSAGGGPVTLLHSETISQPSFPRFSQDGQWIYFNGHPQKGSSVWPSVLYRINSATLEVEQLTEPGAYDEDDSAPDPSPDGTRIAFGSQRGTTYPFQSMIRLLDPSTKTVTDLAAPGTRPRWSPDGQWIAYVVAGRGWLPSTWDREDGAGPLGLVRPDGSDQRVIPTGLNTYHPGLDWSPDGKYLIASNGKSQMDVIVVATGEIIPLTFLRGNGVYVYHPDWKPTG